MVHPDVNPASSSSSLLTDGNLMAGPVLGHKFYMCLEHPTLHKM